MSGAEQMYVTAGLSHFIVRYATVRYARWDGMGWDGMRHRRTPAATSLTMQMLYMYISSLFLSLSLL